MLNRGANYSPPLIPQVSAGVPCSVFSLLRGKKSSHTGQRPKEGGKNAKKKKKATETVTCEVRMKEIGF